MKNALQHLFRAFCTDGKDKRKEWKEKEGPLGYLYGKEMTAPLPETLQKICDGLFGRSE